jgi:5-methylthioadenosine/S-adenosylhomocysteine deaminase
MTEQKTQVDLIIDCGTIITMDKTRRVIKHSSIAIQGDIILEVNDTDTIKQKFSANKVIDARQRTIIPGLINTHTHLFQTFLRGTGQDLPAIDWLHQAIDPVVSHFSSDDSYLSALLGCVEAIKSGTTCIVEYNYVNPHRNCSDFTIQAFIDSGIRGIFARGILDMGDLHPGIIHRTESEITECERLIQTYHQKSGDMIHVWIAPYTIMSTTPLAFTLSRELANRYRIMLTVHSSTPSTIEAAINQYGMGDIKWEDKIGFLGSDVLLVHCCGDLTEEDLLTMKKNNVRISHNPISNCYLGEGIAKIHEMITYGLKVSLASDGPCSNNRQDMFEVMKVASLLQKVKNLDPSCMTANKVLEMATIEGAECIGLGSKIGSIEPGKQADVVILDLWKPNVIAYHDPISAIVYSATAESVETVIINGKIVMMDRELLLTNEQDTLSRSQTAAEALLIRAGVKN